MDKMTTTSTRAGSDRFVSTADLILELNRRVTGRGLLATLHNFRRFDHLVRKPLAVSASSLSPPKAQALLRSVGIPSCLIGRAVDFFTRRRQRSSAWSHALGESPECRIDGVELFSGLALTCRASVKDKLSILFYIFDFGERGLLTEGDLGAMISSCGSFLHRLGLCLPTSGDEAAFAAGTAFGQQRCRTASPILANRGGEPDGDDEIDLRSFLAWAERAELPARAMDMLALPLRLSRTVDFVLIAAASILRERYNFGRTTAAAKSSLSSADRTCGTEPASEYSSSKHALAARGFWSRFSNGGHSPLLSGRKDVFSSGSVVLPLVLRGIGPHSAHVWLEVGACSDPKSESLTLGAIVSVEERHKSRFSLVESQPLILRGGEPMILRLSTLRAATEHRLIISWPVSAGNTKNKHTVLVSLAGGSSSRAQCRTLRFATLPATSVVTPDFASEGETTGASSPNQSSSPRMRCDTQAARRCIALVSTRACCHSEDTFSPGGARLPRPWPTEPEAVTPLSATGISVVVKCGQFTSLGSAGKSSGSNPWWNERAGCNPSSEPNAGVYLQSWPPAALPSSHRSPLSPAASDRGNVCASISVPDFKSAARSAAAQMDASALAAANLHRGGRTVPGPRGEIDIMVHLSPDWRAVEAVRRCFQVLKQCRFQSQSIREDGRRMVSAEVTRAIRSLSFKCFGGGRRTERNGERKSCAHMVVGGLQDPWLGFNERELLSHDEEHRRIVRSEIDLALRRYLVSDAADAGPHDDHDDSGRGTPRRLFPIDGGMMAIGSGCFLVHPHKVRNTGCDEDFSSETFSASARKVRRLTETTARSSTAASASASASASANSSVAVGSIAASSVATFSGVVNPLETTAKNNLGEIALVVASATTSTADEGAGPQPQTEPWQTEAPSANERTAGAEDRSPGGVERMGASGTVDDDTPDARTTRTGEGVSDPEAEKLVVREAKRADNENEGDAAAAAERHPYRTEEAGAGGSHKPSDRRVSPGGSSALASSDQDGEVGRTEDLRNPGDAAKDMPPTEGRGGAFDKNPVLGALLRDMTRAAEAWAMASAASSTVVEAGGRVGASGKSPLVCTIIIFLDAPLIGTGLRVPPGPLPSPLRKESKRTRDGGNTHPGSPYQGAQQAQQASTASRPEAAPREYSAVMSNGEGSGSGSGRGSNGGSGSSDVDTDSTKELEDALHEPSHHANDLRRPDSAGDAVVRYRDSIKSGEYHPAGLGDPGEALEAFLSWMREGVGSDGCIRRDILLICRGERDPPHGDNASFREESQGRILDVGSSDQAALSFAGGEEMLTGQGESKWGASRDGHEESTINISKAAGRHDGSGEEAEGQDIRAFPRADGVDVEVHAGEGKTAALGAKSPASNGAGHKGNLSTGTIRQVILGGTVQIPMAHVRDGEKSANDMAVRTVSAQGLNNRGEGRGERLQVPVAAERLRGNVIQEGHYPLTKAPILSTHFTHLSPSEVLLQTRPATVDCEGSSRVSVAFPPHFAVPTAGVLPLATTAAEGRPLVEGSPRPAVAAGLESGSGSGSGSGTFSSSESVRVLIGPVVGRVAPKSVIILVEATHSKAAAAGPAAVGARTTTPMRRKELAVGHASDGVGVRVTDTLTGCTRRMTGGTWAGGQPCSGPRVFAFEGLTPGRRYAIALSGVRLCDQVARTGGFCTPLEGETPPAMWALSRLGTPVEALEEILADLQTARPTATAALFVGPMVDVSKVGRALYPLVMAERETGQGGGSDRGPSSSIGARALSAFRDLYRQEWNEPRMRRLLAHSSAIPSSAGAGDLLLPLLSNFPCGWLPLNAARLEKSSRKGTAQATRCKRETKRRDRRRRVGGAGKVGGIRMQKSSGGGVARALASVARAALQASREYQEALFGGSAIRGGACAGAGAARGGGGGGDRHRVGARKPRPGLEVRGGGPLPSFQRWGAVGVLSISVMSARVDCAEGGRESERGLLSREAWAWLEAFFKAPEIGWQEGPGLSTLIVVTDSPLLWWSASSFSSSTTARVGAAGADAEHQRRGETAPYLTARGRHSHRANRAEDRNREEAGAGDRASRRKYESADGRRQTLFSFDSPCFPRNTAPSWSAYPREAASLLSLLFWWARDDAVDGGSGGSAGGDDEEQDSSECAGAQSTSTTSGGGGVQSGAAFFRGKLKPERGTGMPQTPQPNGGHSRSGPSGVRSPGRVFSIVCPAVRVKMNVQTYVKDGETGRVAVQWCLASRNGGDEARIPMSGSVGPRFSFTHYPQAGVANGPGATLVRPVPDPSAPFVHFLGLSPRRIGGGGVGDGSCVGTGFGFGTLGPILGEVGTSSARVLVEVSVPMELCLTVRKSGIAWGCDGPDLKGHRQRLAKIIREAHRPVVFEVDGLLPNTRYVLEFSPLANASEFRGSLQTRALRPFSFRVAAFGGSRNPFGFFPGAGGAPGDQAVVPRGGEVPDITTATATTRGTPPHAKRPPGKALLLRGRWPFCAVDALDVQQAVGANAAPLGAPNRAADAAAVGTAQALPSRPDNQRSGGDRGGRNGISTGGFGWAKWSARGADGGGWRHPFSTAFAINAATKEARITDLERESLLGAGGQDALVVAAEVGRLSAWKVVADGVELPAQGPDLVIHLGNEIHAAACLNRHELTELVDSSVRQPLEGASSGTRPIPREEATLSAASKGTGTGAGLRSSAIGGGKGDGRFIMVRPPQLPDDDPAALGALDEEDISQLEKFFIELHDEAERDRKRADGDLRHRRLAEPSLAIESKPMLEDAQEQDVGKRGQRGPKEPAAAAAVGVGAGYKEGSGGVSGREIVGGDDGAADGAQQAWALVKAEVAERARDPYRVAWGLPWAKAVMANAPNAFLAFTPLDLDDGCQWLSDIRSSGVGGGGGDGVSDGGEGDRSADLHAIASRIREERLSAWVEYQAALSPEGGSGRGSGSGARTSPAPTSEAPAVGEKGGKPGAKEDGVGGGSVGKSKSNSAKRETDRGAYREYGGIGVLMLDVWGNQPWRFDQAEMARVRGDEKKGPGFHPRALLSKRQEKLVKKALTSSSINALLICSGTPMVAEPIVHPKAPPLSEEEQTSRDKALSFARKELKKLGKAGLSEIKRMAEEEKVLKLAMLSPEEVGAMDRFYDEARPCFHWSYHSPYLQEMLERLFDWVSEGTFPSKKNQSPKMREVVIVCGGTGCGVRTEVRDRRTGASFTQLCVGRISDPAVPCPWSLEEGGIGDRIVFTHNPIVRSDGGESPPGGVPKMVALSPGKNSGRSNSTGRNSSNGTVSVSSATGTGSSFAVVNFLSEPLGATTAAALVQTSREPPTDAASGSFPDGGAGGEGGEERQAETTEGEMEESQGLSNSRGPEPEPEPKPAAILGPVVGRVEVLPSFGVVRESCRVPVVLEVDQGGEVTCVMRDVATSETFREKRLMKSRRPRAFWMQGLRPARRYAIEFEGVSNYGDRTGSLTTPDSSHPDLTILAVSHDRPGELPLTGGEANLWSALEERLRSPWHGVDAVLHVGGQVDLSNAFEDGRRCLEALGERRKAGKVLELEEASVMKALKARFREEYRKVWNQPNTRKVLASCQHIMAWGQGECSSGYGRGGHEAVSSWAGRRLLRVAKEVFHEYQRQLWDPQWGSPFQIGDGDNESFYLTLLRGTVGVLSLDTLELHPRWTNDKGDSGDSGSGNAYSKSSVDASGASGASGAACAADAADAAAGTATGLDAAAGGGAKGGSPAAEKPLLGNSQWQRLTKVLEEQENLATLIVVTETPIVWHDTEAFLQKTKDHPDKSGRDGNSSDESSLSTTQPYLHLEDHWVSRPAQQHALLTRLFRWKANGGGKEVILLAGAGLAEGCSAAETRLECTLPRASPPQVLEAGPGKKAGEGTRRGKGGGGAKKSTVEGDEERPTEAKRHRIGIEQITCGPVTAEPMAAPEGISSPAKGKVFVPLTEAQKAHNRAVKNNLKNAGGGGGGSSGKGALSVGDQEPVEFTHLKTWDRNYAVLQVIADRDEEGPIGVVDTAIATRSSLDKAHPAEELSRPPRWWYQRCIGDRTVLFDDGVYLKGQGYEATMSARKWLETSEDFTEAARRCYDDFYIADCGRPAELCTIEVEKTAVLRRHVEDGIRAVYHALPAAVANELAYVPDQMILDFLFIKACPEVSVSAFDTAEKWEDVCRQTCIQAAYIRVAALWAEEEDEVLLMADARAEEAERTAAAKLNWQRKQEVIDADREAAEMAYLMENDPEAHMRRVVQKRADDADRRKHEAEAASRDKERAEKERVTLERKKADDRERLAREAKENEAREQRELNELADSDPVEYDRRMKEWYKRKIEGRDGASSTLGGGTDGTDYTHSGDLERRKALARERRQARRAAMHARPPIGIPAK